MKSLNDAMRYHKQLPSHKYVRTFLDGYSAKIVSIILNGLYLDGIDASQKVNVRNCMEAVVDLVSNDLVNACKNGTECHTLSALLEIYDEVTGYSESSAYSLEVALCYTEVITHLGQYLYKIASRSYSSYSDNELRPVPSIPSIQFLVTCLKMTGKLSILRYTGESSLAVARAGMIYVLSLSDDALVDIGDDVIDICSNAEVIYRRTTRDSINHIYGCMFEYLEMQRTLVFRLVNTNSVGSKLLGLAEIEKMSKIIAEFRSYPAAYIVSGAGDESVNGRYEMDASLLWNGRLTNGRITSIRYVKKKSVKQDDGTYYKLAWVMPFGWTLSKACYIENWHDDEEMTVLYSNDHDESFRFKRPLASGWKAKNGALPIPEIKHAGFVLVTGMKATFEHNLVDWMIESNILKQVADDARSIHRNFHCDAKKALKCMMTAIKELLSLISGNLMTQFFCDFDGTALKDVERDHTIVNSIVQHLTNDIGEEAKEMIGKGLITELCVHDLALFRQTISSLVVEV